MKNFTFVAALMLTAGVSIQAASISLQGTWINDDQVQEFTVILGIPGQLTAQTFSYAGGDDGLGHVIARGAFDPVLTLFDGSGNFRTMNNDGACGTVEKDSVTLNCFDFYLSLNLAAGTYVLALTENDNLAVGPTAADGFTQAGNGDFTCPEFMGTAGAFCDASLNQRNASFALTIDTPGARTLEPSSAFLILSGAAICGAARKYLSATLRKS